jgi:hypothetical protein
MSSFPQFPDSRNERLGNAFDREPQVERETVHMNQLPTRRY